MPSTSTTLDVSTTSRIPFEEIEGRSPGSVLIVEDEETVRTTVAKILGAMGFSVVVAVDGHDGVMKFTENPELFRFVLLDLSMPKLDGVQVLTEIRRIAPRIRVVLMSGYGEREATARFSGKGLDGFIAKPFDIPTLRQALKNALM